MATVARQQVIDMIEGLPSESLQELVRFIEFLRFRGGQEAIAKEKRCTPAQLVLAWLLAQGEDMVAIPGTKRKERVDQNLAALQVQLSKEDLERISAAAPVGAGAGSRYPAEGMKRVYL